MSQRLKCFLLIPDEGLTRHSLRRYVSGDNKCPGIYGWHNAENVIDPILVRPEGATNGTNRPETSKEDPRWPAHCACGYQFQPKDEWQERWEPLYRSSDTGELYTLHDAPVGAMWFARASLLKTPG
jgi:hypothetical protein